MPSWMPSWMPFWVALVVVALIWPGCHASNSTLTTSATECGLSASLDDAGPGACAVGRALLECTQPSGGGCLCVTSGSSCPGCGAAGSATCANHCNANEYAVSCGGPPAFDASFTYAQPPSACRSVTATPAGDEYFCCPCE